MSGKPDPRTWMLQRSQTPPMQNTAHDRFLLLDHIQGNGHLTSHTSLGRESVQSTRLVLLSAVSAAGPLSDQCRPTRATPDFLLSASGGRATEDTISLMESGQWLLTDLSNHDDRPGDASVKCYIAGWTLCYMYHPTLGTGNQPSNIPLWFKAPRHGWCSIKI